MENNWYLYVLRCGDGSLYAGITTDVEKRLNAHRTGKGAKYTKGRGPLELVYREQCTSHSDALQKEYRFKQLTKEVKERIVLEYGLTKSRSY